MNLNYFPKWFKNAPYFLLFLNNDIRPYTEGDASVEFQWYIALICAGPTYIFSHPVQTEWKEMWLFTSFSF